MIHSNPFNGRSTADHVLAGIDLTGRRFVVTGCNSGIGFATMNALAANGAHVVGLARVWPAAHEACARVGPTCTPLACDLSDLDSVADAAAAIRALNTPLDAIVANAGTAYLPALRTRYGVEMQFLVNHIGHFALINQLCGRVRDGTGRIVLVSGDDEYRSEEGLPQLARILSTRHGFRCTVLYAIDPQDGTIKPDLHTNIPGLEALDTAGEEEFRKLDARVPFAEAATL
jgi:nucleoside-diphosphate-sugar epimerase